MSLVEPIARKLWVELLEVETVHPEDDFFFSGGHSILAARLTAGLSDELGVHVPVALLFDQPTYGAFVLALSSHISTGT